MRALVVGGGPQALPEYCKALSYTESDDLTIAVNHAGIHLPVFDHWVSLHARELFYQWNPSRACPLPHHRLWGAYSIRDNSDLHHLPLNWCSYCWDGSSSALAINVARVLGAQQILLCGVPLEDGPHFYDGPDFTQSEYTREQWSQHLHELTGVRSMGGWTKQVLGGFDPSWWRQP